MDDSSHSLASRRQDDDGRSLLHWACVSGQQNIVEFLLEHRAEVCVCACVYALCLIGFLKSRMQVNTRDEGGFSPLISAASAGRLEIVKLLIEHDADVNVLVRSVRSIGSFPFLQCCSCVFLVFIPVHVADC